MTNFNPLMHWVILLLGITPPKPGQERRVAIIFGVTVMMITGLTVALALGLARVMYR